MDKYVIQPSNMFFCKPKDVQTGLICKNVDEIFDVESIPNKE